MRLASRFQPPVSENSTPHTCHEDGEMHGAVCSVGVALMRDITLGDRSYLAIRRFSPSLVPVAARQGANRVPFLLQHKRSIVPGT